MTVTIEKETEVKFDFDYENTANLVIEKSISVENFPYEAEVNLLLVDSDAIQEINREHRGIDKATDVLSFPMIEYDVPGDFSGVERQAGVVNPDTGETLLGDIVICVPKVFEQAREYGHEPKREFAFLITHSMLHLFGYDHMEPDEAAIMENKQKTILNELEIFR